jgi:pyruvate,water dikinase
VFKFLRRFLKDEKDPQEVLREKFSRFRRLLEGNNQALADMADMEEKLAGDFLFDTGYLETQVKSLADSVSRMVAELNELTDQQYPELSPILARLAAEINQELTAAPEIPDTPYIIPLPGLTREMAPAVGGKMANLGEIANRVGLPAPRGFAISAAAYKKFLEDSGLAQELARRLERASFDDLAGLQALSRDLQALVRQAELPRDLEEILRLAAQALPTTRLAVRSSAVGEDSEYSFAGQFATLLNVDAADLPRHYKEIVASKFTTQAIFYWKYQNFSVHELPMAVGVLAMAPARASGIAFSLDPQHPAGGAAVITAVWGLGRYAVEGVINPDFYEVARQDGHQVLTRRVAHKPVALVCREEGGAGQVALPPEQADAACLDEPQLKALTQIALRLEEHFGGPQDIEWALDDDGKFIILQSRPLRISKPSFAGPAPESTRLADRPPLLDYGVRAVGGAAAGPVQLFTQGTDLDQIPPGAVVVARQPSVRLVVVMDRISAIITEVGSPTDHMTILAREFQVPTLVEVGGASRLLQPGQVVTVDADGGRIYAGVVQELLARRRKGEEPWRQNQVFQKLRLILKKTAPLNLLDPASPDFVPASCRTLHDLTRFCHEKAMDAMFSQDVEQAVQAVGVRRLQTDLPMNLFVLDLGGGLKVQAEGREIAEDDILSRPFRAVLRGFHHPQVRWAGQVGPADLKGFISVFANTMYDMGKAETGLGGKSFAILSDVYLNFHSRLGYHFGLVDAYCSPEQNDNYISFQFKGGAASIDRRERRVRLLRQILEDLGFTVQIRGDLVQGRLVKYSLLETEDILEFVGLLMVFCRSLDLALVSDTVVDRCFQAFKNKDYNLSFLRPETR